MPWDPLQWVQKRAWSCTALEGQSRHGEYRKGPGGSGHSFQTYSHSKNLLHRHLLQLRKTKAQEVR